MKLRHLQYFIAVAEELNFTRAAQRLRTSQPSLSQQILALEADIGFPLLTRTKRRVELTEVGKVFLNEARQAVMQVEHAIHRARRAGRPQAQTLHLSCTPSAEHRLLPSLLPALRLDYPNLKICLHSLSQEAQTQALVHGELDAAFMYPPVAATSLSAQAIDREPLLIFLPLAHPLSHLHRIAPHRLDGEHRVTTDAAHHRALNELAARFLSRHGVRGPTVSAAPHLQQQLQLVSQGAGYALLPAYAATLADERICVRRFERQAPELDLLLVHRRGDPSPLLAALRHRARSAATALAPEI